MYRVASDQPVTSKGDSRTRVERAFHGASQGDSTSGLTQRDIVRVASRYMNEGLYGADLLQALKKRFDPRDLVASKDALRQVLGEQGLQGIFYVDPASYSDYGACDEGSRLHRARQIPYVKMGPKCSSCVNQTEAGHCSKYAKQLVLEPPYTDKRAQQRAILASGNATETRFEDIVNNGMTMLAEYQMQQDPLQVEVDAAPKTDAVVVEFHNAGIKL